MIALSVRVSSAGQNEDRQVESLVQLAGERPHKIYMDRCSGTIPFSERPRGAALVRDVEDGTISEVWFHEVSRAGRNTRDVLNTLHHLVEKGIQVRIHKEGLKLLDENTGRISPVAGLILSVLASVAEMENEQRRERQREGIALRKLRGGYAGRAKGTVESPEKFLSKKRNQRIIQFLLEGTPVVHIASIVGCSRQLVRKVRDIGIQEGILNVEMVAR